MSYPPRLAGRTAFTLIELLSVVAIIGVLAALSMAVVSRMRASADDASCVNNMRSLAVGMAAYVNDYGTLPGPAAGGVTAGYTSDTRNLPFYLQPYLKYAQPTKTKQYAPPFICPAAVREYGMEPLKSMTTMVTVSLPDGTRPFGYPSDSGKGRAEDPPKSLVVVAGANDASGNSGAMANFVLLMEVDRYSENWKGKPPWGPTSVPLKPLHGNHHNAIFGDFHVGPVKPVDPPK